MTFKWTSGTKGLSQFFQVASTPFNYQKEHCVKWYAMQLRNMFTLFRNMQHSNERQIFIQDHIYLANNLVAQNKNKTLDRKLKTTTCVAQVSSWIDYKTNFI